MGPKLVDYLLYEPEDSGILWIKFNRPDRMNALVGTSEENGTVAKVGSFHLIHRCICKEPSAPFSAWERPTTFNLLPVDQHREEQS